jgi:hypothetical protein
LDRRLLKTGYDFEWADIKQDLKALQEISREDHNKKLAIRTECKGTCGKIFQAVGVATPTGRYRDVHRPPKDNLWCQELFERVYVPEIAKVFFGKC